MVTDAKQGNDMSGGLITHLGDVLGLCGPWRCFWKLGGHMAVVAGQCGGCRVGEKGDSGCLGRAGMAGT